MKRDFFIMDIVLNRGIFRFELNVLEDNIQNINTSHYLMEYSKIYC